MEPEQFIREFGEKKAREVVEGAPEGAELFHANTYIKNAHSEGKNDHFARWSEGFGDWISASADRDFIDESVDLFDLKRLVGSLDLIEVVGGIQEAISFAGSSLYFTADRVSMYRAIRDHESIYGGGENA